MNFIDTIKERAKTDIKTIVLPETEDKFRRNWAINSLRALMSILSDAIREDSPLSASFYNELFNTIPPAIEVKLHSFKFVLFNIILPD